MACCSLPSRVTAIRSCLRRGRHHGGSPGSLPRGAAGRSRRRSVAGGDLCGRSGQLLRARLGDAQYVYAGPEPDLTTDQLQAVLETAEGQPVYAETTAEPFPALFRDRRHAQSFHPARRPRRATDHRRDHRLRRSNVCVRSGRDRRSGSDALTRVGCAGPFSARAEAGAENLDQLFVVLNDATPRLLAFTAVAPAAETATVAPEEPVVPTVAPAQAATETPDTTRRKHLSPDRDPDSAD